MEQLKMTHHQMGLRKKCRRKRRWSWSLGLHWCAFLFLSRHAIRTQFSFSFKNVADRWQRAAREGHVDRRKGVGQISRQTKATMKDARKKVGLQGRGARRKLEERKGDPEAKKNRILHPSYSFGDFEFELWSRVCVLSNCLDRPNTDVNQSSNAKICSLRLLILHTTFKASREGRSPLGIGTYGIAVINPLGGFSRRWN